MIKYLYHTPIFTDGEELDAFNLKELCMAAEGLEVPSLCTYAAVQLESLLKKMLVDVKPGLLEDMPKVDEIIDIIQDILSDTKNEGQAMAVTDVAVKFCCNHFDLLRLSNHFSNLINYHPELWQMMVEYIVRQRKGSLL